MVLQPDRFVVTDLGSHVKAPSTRVKIEDVTDTFAQSKPNTLATQPAGPGKSYILVPATTVGHLPILKTLH